MALARQLEIDFPAEYEVAGYLNEHRWGYFSILSRKTGTSRAYQSSYPLKELPRVLKMATSNDAYDNWITQAVFRVTNRRKVNLASVGTAFVDLDYYNLNHLIGLDPEKVLQLVLARCKKTGVPEPSIVIDSGKGLQMKWFHEPLPKKALPRWETMQRHLVEHFRDLGGDHHARDVSRVLRVVHSINQKTLNRVEVLWVNNRFEVDEPIKYSFNTLIDQIIPDRPVVRPAKRRTGAVAKLNPAKHQFTTNSLNWTRLCDLQKLIEIRGGDVGEGMREPLAFYLCNFYGLRYHKELCTRPVDDWQEFRQLCQQAAPHWDAAKIRNKTSNLYDLTRRTASGETVEYNGKEYTPLYTPRNDTLINQFEMTDDELKLMGTIISDSEKQRRDAEYQEKKRREKGAVSRADYEAKAQDNKAKAIALKAQGMKQKDIAEALGVHVKSVSRLLRG